MQYVDGHGDVREMTLPDERYRAVRMGTELLLDLCDSRKTPRIPREIRLRAAAVLRHYPTKLDLDRAAESAPEVFVERMEPLYRMIKQHDEGEG